ncbi:MULTISPECIES: AMP-binding protein [unclassified Marinobacter]|jgi:2-furoate---CoA ligase|uniref:AMP-binding protein n=1 Tax=unclassified Marinobacter TaxID=83889 RepID=UPI00200FD8F8|nr:MULTISPECIES: AMP-binding protein [unclassified Marinobacter]MCL1481451.1 AMP-binding protein [Marinobacter sp.]UQG54503.1 AMP-binding protein [Marinobacter sp. M4C]UQG63308.1 AMP-binding protein [Marinobacter sp. M2C]UQG67588.1 AMP-binding protein [Marinobacter sp. M1C]
MFDLGRSFLAAVERRPWAIAIADGDIHKRYDTWFEDIQSVARALEGFGLRKGDRLLVVMQNRWQMATLHWACQFAGIIITPVNWRSTAQDLAFFIQDSGARVLVYDGSAGEAVDNCAEAQAMTHIAVGEVGSAAAHDFDTLLGGDGETVLRATPEDLSLMLYTSGTSGKPKGVPRLHRAERAAALAHVAQNLYGHDECTLGVMPLYHTMGVRSLLAMALIDGKFVCVPKFDPEVTLEVIKTEQVTNLYLVPTLYHMLMEHPGFLPERVKSVDKLGYAGAPMSAGLIGRVEAAFKPALFVNHYGSSEIYTFTINQNASRKPGSSGRASLNQRIRVVKAGAGMPDAIMPVGKEGEIIADMEGDEAFQGYWQRPDADQKSIRDGWYFTSDTGYFDADGDLFVTGRVDDLIITGGENVSPAEIEDVLSLHPQIEEVVVVGTPDERWGSVVTAFVKCRETLEEKELDRYCIDGGLTRFKRPRRYVFINEIPKSPIGKVLRRVLRDQTSSPAKP